MDEPVPIQTIHSGQPLPDHKNKNLMTSDDYKKAFGLSKLPKVDRERALNLALEIRKFEIELYWKRATYFWAFIAVALAGYVTVLVAKGLSDAEKGQALLTASCLGIVFSVAWYFVNRASKFWQENWEKHVDLLEDAEIGPIYKTVLSDEDLRFWHLFKPYRFSVSKLNQILSLFVVLLFSLLTAATLWRYFHFGCPRDFFDVFATAMVILTVGAVGTLYKKGQTDAINKPEHVHAERRTTEIV
jgi:hypothetical protein